jgi:hypothetical protein
VIGRGRFLPATRLPLFSHCLPLSDSRQSPLDVSTNRGGRRFSRNRGANGLTLHAGAPQDNRTGWSRVCHRRLRLGRCFRCRPDLMGRCERFSMTQSGRRQGARAHAGIDADPQAAAHAAPAGLSLDRPLPRADAGLAPSARRAHRPAQPGLSTGAGRFQEASGGACPRRIGGTASPRKSRPAAGSPAGMAGCSFGLPASTPLIRRSCAWGRRAGLSYVRLHVGNRNPTLLSISAFLTADHS